MQVLTLEVDRSSKRPYNTHIATKERTMLKLIGIIVVVYIGWAIGLIQAVLLVTAGLLTTIAGA
jgi:tetrahydromethanopterin S-methyltransferase subunit F